MEFFKPHKTLSLKSSEVEAASPQSPNLECAAAVSELSCQVDQHIKRGELGSADHVSRKMLALAQGGDHSASVPALPPQFKIRRRNAAVLFSVAAVLILATFDSMHTRCAIYWTNIYMANGAVNYALPIMQAEYAIECAIGKPKNSTLDVIADILASDGRFVEATTITEKVLSSPANGAAAERGYGWAYNLDGFMQLERGNYLAAEYSFKESIARNFSNIRGLAPLIRCYVALGKIDEAKVLVNTLGLTRPTSIPAPDLSTAEALGDYAGAIGDLAEQRMWYLYAEKKNHQILKCAQSQYVRVAKKYAQAVRQLGYTKEAADWDDAASVAYARGGLAKTDFALKEGI